MPIRVQHQKIEIGMISPRGDVWNVRGEIHPETDQPTYNFIVTDTETDEVVPLKDREEGDEFYIWAALLSSYRTGSYIKG